MWGENSPSGLLSLLACLVGREGREAARQATSWMSHLDSERNCRLVDDEHANSEQPALGLSIRASPPWAPRTAGSAAGLRGPTLLAAQHETTGGRELGNAGELQASVAEWAC